MSDQQMLGMSPIAIAKLVLMGLDKSLDGVIDFIPDGKAKQALQKVDEAVEFALQVIGGMVTQEAKAYKAQASKSLSLDDSACGDEADAKEGE